MRGWFWRGMGRELSFLPFRSISISISTYLYPRPSSGTLFLLCVGPTNSRSYLHFHVHIRTPHHHRRFWMSDEYGPYIYKFTSSGALIQAIQPPAAILPIDKSGNVNFTSVVDPETGRAGNQGKVFFSCSRLLYLLGFSLLCYLIFFWRGLILARMGGRWPSVK